jgi:hypothetical protein
MIRKVLEISLIFSLSFTQVVIIAERKPTKETKRLDDAKTRKENTSLCRRRDQRQIKPIIESIKSTLEEQSNVHGCRRSKGLYEVKNMTNIYKEDKQATRQIEIEKVEKRDRHRICKILIRLNQQAVNFLLHFRCFEVFFSLG